MTIRAPAAFACIVAIAVVLPATAGAQDGGSSGDPPSAGPASSHEPSPARLSVRVKKTKTGTRPALSKATVVGRLRPFVPRQKVQLQLVRGGKLVKRKNVRIRRAAGGHGTFRLRSPKLIKPGKYRVLALKRGNPEQVMARARSQTFTLKFPQLKHGSRGNAVALFNRLLRQRGYYAPVSRSFGPGTARAVLAFRKVNWMSRTTQATPAIFKKLAAGNGGFKLRRPGAGRHVEVDLARQVMVLADKGKPQHTFHISSGKPSTRSTRGHFRFNRREPGMNGVGMYYSVYYHGGEATHGYKSVPTYPASAGCIRNPTPNSRFIYNWVRLGMSIFVY